MSVLKPIFVSFLTLQLAWTLTPCPIFGPAFPEPRDLTSEYSHITKSWPNLTSQIKARFAEPPILWKDFGISIGAFSIHDANAAQELQFHHTGARLSRNATHGTQQVNGDSIYRVASITKLVTVYIFLLEFGSNFWNYDLTARGRFPELHQNQTVPLNPIDMIDGAEITLAALASHMAGVPSQAALNAELSGLAPEEWLEKLGLPPLTGKDAPKCPVGGGCEGDDWWTDLKAHGPVFEQWRGPSYSNPAFGLLAAWMEKQSARGMEEMLKTDLLGPLDLMSTSWTMPNNTSNAVVPDVPIGRIWWNMSFGAEAAAGSAYSSLNDLNKLGISILNSTLLSKTETQQWLKPVTHTANAYTAIGRPWEIYRLPLPCTDRITDMYTKGGALPTWGSYLVLFPEHGAGFTILAAGDLAPLVANQLLQMATQTIGYAFEEQAVEEARLNFAGTYASMDSDLNSSLTLNVDATDSANPGLVIEEWISNGTNLLQSIFNLDQSTRMFSELQMAEIRAGHIQADLRLYPTIEDRNETGKGWRQAFRWTPQLKGLPQYPKDGPLAGLKGCLTWAGIDGIYYGREPVEKMVFERDAEGRAISVEIPWLRARLVSRTSPEFLDFEDNDKLYVSPKLQAERDWLDQQHLIWSEILMDGQKAEVQVERCSISGCSEDQQGEL